MSLIDLTKDLSNFNWTEYSKAGTGKSPQTDKTPYFERPNPKSLEQMESKFGLLDTSPPSRGPYGVSDTMDGTKQGRGFIKPGIAPFGFTKDMDLFHNKSELEIGNELSITPLSHNIAGVTSNLSYGQVGKKELNLEPQAKGAYGVDTLPISTYSNRQPIEDIPFGAIGGNNTYYGNISVIAGRKSQFQDGEGKYTTPTQPVPFGDNQKTFLVPDSYPRNDFAFSINSQFGWSNQSKYLMSHGTPWREFKQLDTLRDQIDSGGGGGQSATPDSYPPLPDSQQTQHVAQDFFISSEPNYNAPSYLSLQFLRNFGNTGGIWPYGVLPYQNPKSTGPNGGFNDHPLIIKDVGERYSQGGPIENYMVLQAKRTEDDTERLTKWFETPKGQLWIGKQNVLQELNPRAETRTFSLQSQKLSIPPFMHFNRHIGGDTYMSVADFGPIYDGDSEPSDQGFADGSLGDKITSHPSFAKLTGKFEWATDGLAGLVGGLSDLNDTLGNINFNKKGGRLRFLTNTMVAGSETGTPFSLGSLGSINLTDLRNGVSPFGRPPKIPTQTVFSQRGPFGEQNLADNQLSKTPIKKYHSTLYGDIGKEIKAPALSPITHQSVQSLLGGLDAEIDEEGNISLLDQSNETWKDLSLAQVKNNKLYFNEQIDAPTRKKLTAELHRKNKIAVKQLGGIGDPGRLSNAFTQNVDDKKGSGLGTIKTDLAGGDGYKSMAVDRVNSTPYGHDLPEGVSDYIKFKFKDLVNNKFIIFRALLSGVSDSISPEWNGTRYIGRPDQVYTYTGVERKISFSFDIYPKTKQEFPILLEKLNYLVGLCYPSYAENNRMIAPFINLTIGDMLNQAPGFLDSLSVEVNDTTTWETDEGLQFPKHITCQCSYTYIGNHQPSMLGLHYGLNWLEDKGYGVNTDGSKNVGTFKVAEGGDIRETPAPFRIGKEKLFDEFGAQDKSTSPPTDPFYLSPNDLNDFRDV